MSGGATPCLMERRHVWCSDAKYGGATQGRVERRKVIVVVVVGVGVIYVVVVVVGFVIIIVALTSL